MARYKGQGISRDQYGNTIPQATITVYLTGTLTLATIYSSSVGGSPITGSYVTSDNFGFYSFWIDRLSYSYSQKFRITVAKAGIDTKIYDDINIFNLPTELVTLLTNINDHFADISSITNITDVKTFLTNIFTV